MYSWRYSGNHCMHRDYVRYDNHRDNVHDDGDDNGNDDDDTYQPPSLRNQTTNLDNIPSNKVDDRAHRLENTHIER